MARSIIGMALMTGCALALAGCGGGSGDGVNFQPSPPAPPPPPQPAPVLLDIIPNTTQSTTFATLGLEAAVDRTTVTADGFSVAFDASSGTYVIDVPAAEPGKFYNSWDLDGSTWGGTLARTVPSPDTSVEVLRPTNPELPLTYTGLAGYYHADAFGWMAFGSATPAGGVPVTGTATYEALIRGSTLDSVERIFGDATLSFDFAAGTLSGHLNPRLFSDYDWGTYELGRYDFVNTVYSAGSTSFFGQLSNPLFSQNGSFNGQFTGPAAQELMARWSAPYRHPLSTGDSVMFGVLVGRR